jgi:hypothetical protein
MANIRPDRSNKKHRESFQAAPEVPVEEPIRGFFFDEYQSMHSEHFRPPPAKAGGGSQLIAQTSQLESLVSTLAHLQFTMKGKLDSDGNMEFIFCSPDPVLTQVSPSEVPRISDVPSLPPEERRVSFQETKPKHSSREDKTRKMLERSGWIRKKRK